MTVETYYYAKLIRESEATHVKPYVHPHPLPHSWLDRPNPDFPYSSTWGAVYSQRSLIALGEGETYPEAFEHYVQKAQTKGSAPRRTYLALADWEAKDYKTGAKLRADVMIGHDKHVDDKLLADEQHHRSPASERHDFEAMRYNLTEQIKVHGAGYAAIDALPDGKPVSDDELQGFIETARNLPLAILAVTKSGYATVPLGRNVWAFKNQRVGHLAGQLGEVIEIEVQLEGSDATVKTKTGEHVVIT